MLINLLNAISFVRIDIQDFLKKVFERVADKVR